VHSRGLPPDPFDRSQELDRGGQCEVSTAPSVEAPEVSARNDGLEGTQIMRRYFRGMFRAICERGSFETFRTGHVAVIVPALMLLALLPLALVLLPETSSSRGLEAGLAPAQR
jgi:hypothetical protein